MQLPLSPDQLKSVLTDAGKMTNGWDKEHFDYDGGMGMYALSYMHRLYNGECMNDGALGIISHWGRKYFSDQVEVAYKAWWAIHITDSCSAT